jgi:hypothetical protein
MSVSKTDTLVIFRDKEAMENLAHRVAGDAARTVAQSGKQIRIVDRSDLKAAMTVAMEHYAEP